METQKQTTQNLQADGQVSAYLLLTNASELVAIEEHEKKVFDIWWLCAR